MADVPSLIKFGGVVGHFVQYKEDGVDVGTTPDQVGLNGTGTLTPSVSGFQVAGATPPVWVNLAPVPFKVVAGALLSVNDLPLFVVASVQPEADVDLIQWTATFNLVGSSVQPGTVTFDVGDGTITDISQVVPATPAPGTVQVFVSRPKEVLILEPLGTVPPGTPAGTLIVRKTA